MKKLLLLAVAGLLAVGASAQKPSPFYELPAGTFYAGYAKQAYSLSNTMLHVPPFTDLTFTYNNPDATSFIWSYPEPTEEYNFLTPLKTSTESSITLNYWPSSSTMDAPYITATNEEGDSLGLIPRYMRVGGSSTVNPMTGTYFGFANVSSKMGASLYYSSGYYMTNNATSATNWQRIAKVDSASLRGFGELFYSSGAPMALKGISTLIRLGSANVLPDCNIQLNIYEATLTATGALSSINRIGYQSLAPEEIEVEDNGTRAYLLFDKLRDTNGNLVDGFTVTTPILATIVLSNPASTSQFGLYYRNIPNNIAGHAYVILNGRDSDGNAFTGSIRDGNLNWTSGTYTRSLGINMLGSFEYLVEAESKSRDALDKKFPSTGGTEVINMLSSIPYADELGIETNWTITSADGTELPEWISVDVEDDYVTPESEVDAVYQNKSKVTLTVSPLLFGKGPNRANIEPRTASVKISYLGAEYIINVTQESPNTAIDNITVDQAGEGVTYDMLGRRVNADAKGLLIRDGKKVLVK